MTAPLIVQPDAEQWIYQHLAVLGGGVTAFTFAAVQLDQPGWVYAYSVQVDCRAGRKSAARDLSERARQLVLALPAVPWPEGVICYARAVEGPFWLPDDDGAPRYCTRWEIRVHPSREPAPATGRPEQSPPPSPRRDSRPRAGNHAAPVATGKEPSS